MRSLTLVALALAVVTLCFLPGQPPRPSVVLITIDTLRPDRLGGYGHPKNHTPALDQLAREGTLFEAAYCDVPWTTGSMASVMTGLYNPHHGVQLPSFKLTPESVTMAELLHARGYQTGAIIGSFPLDSVYGLDQGFEVYDDEFSMPMIAVEGQPVRHIGSDLPEDGDERHAFILEKFKNDAYRPDEDVTDAAIRWVNELRGGQPFLLWVHYFGPHEKLRGDVSFVSQEPAIIAAYDADVEATDRAVGRFITHLRARQLLDDTLLIVHSDHGQNLGEHDYVGHGMRLDEEAVRIPLIVRYPPRVPAGVRRADIVRNIDILPTVLDATRVDPPHAPYGRSLLSPRWGASPDPPRESDGVAYFETRLTTIVYRPLTVAPGMVLGPVIRLGLRTAEWRYVTRQVVGPCVRGEPERDPFGAWSMANGVAVDPEECKTFHTSDLYRLSKTGEPEEVSADYPVVMAALDATVRALANDTARPGDGEFALSPEQERKLRSLGYLQ